MCGLGRRPVLGVNAEGTQGSLVEPAVRPLLVLREEPALPPWVFYREPPLDQRLPAGPEDDPVFLPPSPTILSRSESSPLPGPGLAPVEPQTDAAEAAVEENAETAESFSCFCGKPDSVENMVACGTDPHPGEAAVVWFHQSCAGLKKVPAEGEQIRDWFRLVLYLHASIDEEWYCGDCQTEMDAVDIARRVGSGGKKLPGASSPTLKPQAQDEEEVLGPDESEETPSDSSLSPRPLRRKRKAESIGPERPKKRHTSGATMGHGGPTTPTLSAPRLAKRKADDAEHGPPQKKHKVGTDQGGATMPQPATTEGQAAPSTAHCRGTPWSAAEEEATITIMKDLVTGKNAVYGDKRWEVCAKRLKKDHGHSRSGPAVKNHWNRVLRARTGLDERRTPNPGKMVTGSLTPRKKQRTAQNLVSRSALSTVREEDGEGEEERIEDQDEEEEEVEELTEEGRIQKEDDWDSEPYVPSRKRKLRGGAEY